jgi:hypothetical protein
LHAELNVNKLLVTEVLRHGSHRVPASVSDGCWSGLAVPTSYEVRRAIEVPGVNPVKVKSGDRPRRRRRRRNYQPWSRP